MSALLGRWPIVLLGLGALLAASILACGPAASATTTNAQEVGPAASVEESSVPSGSSSPGIRSLRVPTPSLPENPAFSSAAPTPVPMAAADAADEIVFVTPLEPGTLSAWSEGCFGNAANFICQDIVSDPLTWIDSGTFEVVPLTGIESWSQRARDRWRFKLREGVTFHNGEPWNAEAAKRGLGHLGDEQTEGHRHGSFGIHGVVWGEVVNGQTVDVVCAVACPILPRTTIFTAFQAPGWWAEATDHERETTTVGQGPYRVTEYKSGVEVRLEAFEDYLPNDAADSRAPTIENARQVWQPGLPGPRGHAASRQCPLGVGHRV